MKRILAIIFVLLSVTTVAYAADDEHRDVVSALGLLPAYGDSNSDEAVLREELAYSIAKIMNSGELQPANSYFADVDAANSYSGYIEYLYNLRVVSGNGGREFLPKEGASPIMAYKLIIECMGYGPAAEAQGGYPEGYAAVASNLGLTKGVYKTQEGYITRQGMINLLWNALMAEYSDASVGTDGSIYYDKSNGTKTLLSNSLGISAYDAVVTDVDDSSYRLYVQIERNKYDTNKNPIAAGTNKSFSASGTVDINKFEDVPVTVYADNDDTVVLIYPQKNVEVSYRTIYSVNGDSTRSNSYAPQYINSIRFIGDTKRYTAEENLRVKLGGVLTEAPVELAGSFAKVVTRDSKIIFIGTWKLEEGGIITSVSDTQLQFIKGSNSNARLRNIDEYTKKLVFIDGESTDISHLRKDTYFQYYQYLDEMLVIVASEKIITDVLYDVGEDEIHIGDIYYDRASTLYLADEKGSYSIGGRISELINLDVDAFFNHAGECVYIRRSAQEQAVKTKFLGVLVRYFYNEFDDEKGITVWVLEPEITKQTFIIDDKTVFNDGIDFERFISSGGSYSGTGIYEFEINRRGAVRSVSKPTPYPGFDSGKATTTIIGDDDYPYVGIGNKLLFWQDAEIAAIYNDNGEFSVRKVSYSELRNTDIPEGATIYFFGDEDSTEIRMAVLCGSGLSGLHNRIQSYAVVTKNKLTINSDDEPVCNLTLVGKSELELTVTEEIGREIPSKAFVEYYRGAVFGENNITFGKVIDITDNFEKVDAGSGLMCGFVNKIDSRVIWLTTGEVYCFHPTWITFVEMDKDNPSDVKPIKAEDIDEGDKVYYYLTEGAVRMVIAVR